MNHHTAKPSGVQDNLHTATEPLPDASQNPKRHKKQKRKHTVLKYAETLAKRDGWVCRYCSTALVPKGRFGESPYYTTMPFYDDFGNLLSYGHILNQGYALYAVDHIHPYSKGGTDDLNNLALACITCNSQKRDKSVDEFLAWRQARGLS